MPNAAKSSASTIPAHPAHQIPNVEPVNTAALLETASPDAVPMLVAQAQPLNVQATPVSLVSPTLTVALARSAQHQRPAFNVFPTLTAQVLLVSASITSAQNVPLTLSAPQEATVMPLLVAKQAAIPTLLALQALSATPTPISVFSVSLTQTVLPENSVTLALAAPVSLTTNALMVNTVTQLQVSANLAAATTPSVQAPTLSASTMPVSLVSRSPTVPPVKSAHPATLASNVTETPTAQVSTRSVSATSVPNAPLMTNAVQEIIAIPPLDASLVVVQI